MLKRSKKRKKTRTGKAGITRLSAEDMAQTRHDVYMRAHGYCQMKERLVADILCSTMTEKQMQVAIERIVKGCWIWASELHGHDCHLQTKRNHGDDLSNRVWGCPACHGASHNSFNKPVPPKPTMEELRPNG